MEQNLYSTEIKMSVLIYQGRRPENQLRVSHKDVVDYLMSGWFLVPYSAVKQGVLA